MRSSQTVHVNSERSVFSTANSARADSILAMDPSSAISIPHQLWRWYVDYLVYYTPDSWVASAARTFRILGVLMLLPFALLTLLVCISPVVPPFLHPNREVPPC